MVNYLNSTSQQWFHWQWAMLWQTAVLIAIIWLLDMLIRKWAHPQLRYALWMLILVKLLIPPTWTSPASVTSHIPGLSQKAMVSLSSPPAKGESLEGGRGLSATPASVPHHPQRRQDASYVPLEAAAQGSSGILPESNMPTEPTPNPAATVMERADASTPSLSWQVYPMLIWLAGIIILSTWLIVRLSSLRREHQITLPLQRGSTPKEGGGLPERFHTQLQEVAQKLNLKRIPRVVLTDKVACPAVFGIFRPVLLMPAAKFKTMTRQDTEHILLHELAHIKRGDLLVHAVYMIAQIAYWFNPLIWMARRPMQNLRELCCDATVAKLLKEDTVHYRQTLLETARQLLAEPVDPGLGLLGLFENNNWLITRLHWLEKKTWKNRPLRIATIIVLATIMTACVLPMANKQKSANTQELVDGKPIIRWSMAGVKDDFIQRIQKNGEYIKTESKSYDCYKFSGIQTTEFFRTLINDPNQSVIFKTKDLWLLKPTGSRRTASARTDSGNLKNGPFVGYAVGGAGPYKFDYKKDKYQLDIEHEAVNCLLNSGSNLNGSVFYKGDLTAGEALVFVGKMPETDNVQPYHLIIYLAGYTNKERFESTNSELPTKNYTATLPNGTTVELLGICEHPSDGKQWWKPDGSWLSEEQRPYKKVSGKTNTVNTKTYEAAFKVVGAGSDDASISIADHGGLFVAYGDGVYCKTIGVEPEKRKLDLNVGVATGLWQTKYEEEVVADGGMSMSSMGEVTFARPIEQSGKTVMTTSYSIDTDIYQVRLIAIDKEGSEVTSGYQSTGNDTYSTLTATFAPPIADIKEFQFQTRPYNWVTFKNVALRPKEDKRFKVVGTVTNAETGKPIAGAEVYDDGYDNNKCRITTDENGSFTLYTANEEHNITAKATGYQPQSKGLYTWPFANNKDFNFELTQKSEPESTNTELPTTNSQNYTATLPNGVTVELLGVCDSSEKKNHSDWWSPDGSPLLEELPNLHYGVEQIRNRYPHAWTLMYQLHNQPPNTLTRVILQDKAGSFESLGPVTQLIEKDEKKFNIDGSGWITIGSDTPLDSKNIQLGVSADNWLVTAKHPAQESDEYEGWTIRQVGWKTEVNFPKSLLAHPSLSDYVVAIKKSGGIYKPITLEETPKGYHASFAPTLQELKEIQIRKPIYDWVTFKNVSLRPGGKTDVQVEIDDGQSTKDDVAEALSRSNTIETSPVSRGKLEFRIIPQSPISSYAAPGETVHVELEQIISYRDQLKQKGATISTESPFVWLPLKEDTEVKFSGIVERAEYNGKQYILACSTVPMVMLADGSWGLEKVYAHQDAQGRPAVVFEFDESGAKLFGELTKTYHGNAVAIVIDGEIYSAPKIMSTIRKQGMIVGNFTEQQAEQLAEILEKGMVSSLSPQASGEKQEATLIEKSIQTVTFHKNMLLTDAFGMLSEMYKVNIIPSEVIIRNRPRVPVTNLYDVTFEDILKAVCGTTHTYEIKDNFVYVYTNEEYAAVPKEVTLKMAKKAIPAFFAERNKNVSECTILELGELTTRDDGTKAVRCKCELKTYNGDTEIFDAMFFFDKTGNVADILHLQEPVKHSAE